MRGVLLIILATALAGCGAARSTALAAGAPESAERDPASLRLEEIEPRPALDAPAQLPERTEPVPLDALELYARARDALIQNRRATAIRLLEEAVHHDPDSFELRYTLGQAYAASGVPSRQAIAAFEAAAALNPDNLNVQAELGRQYFVLGDVAKGIEHLRLARQTSEYREDQPLAAVVDFYLARALQVAGYDRAAIEVYERLRRRLQHGGLLMRSSPELSYLTSQPEAISRQLGELYLKRGQYDQAIKAFESVVQRRPEAFEVHEQIVRALLEAGRARDAGDRAIRVLREFRGSAASVALLRQAFENQGQDAAIAERLGRVHRQTPRDSIVLLTLVDVLVGLDRTREAEALLERAVVESSYSGEMVRRLFRLYERRDDVDAGARLLVETLAHRPDSIRDLGEMWTDLLRGSRRNRLTLSRLKELKVSPKAEASRLLWVSRLAQIWQRDVLARTSLELSVKLTPPFAPSYRVLVAEYATRSDWDQAQRHAQTTKLINSVREQGNEVLAGELEGLVQLVQGNAAEASRRFARAIRLGGNAIDLRLSYAIALRASNESARAEQVLWKLIEDEPTCADAYGALFRHYLEAGEAEQAMSVLQRWLSNDPNSPSALILQAAVMLQLGQFDRSERILLDLFEREPENGEVLAAMNAFYTRTGRINEFIARLEEIREEHPENRVAAEQLVGIFMSRQDLASAIRVLDATRQAVGDDPDLLYYIGSLYARIGQQQTMEEVMHQVLEHDPRHPPANNDLGYTWADRGEHLDRAEKMIRVAVEAEPDNQAYLDSLAWVLYKRGRFEEARKYLLLAVEPASLPDPVILDHLGDVLYRLGNRDEALRHWLWSQERLQQTMRDREDLRRLRLELEKKIRQFHAGEPVDVAPIVEGERASERQAAR